MFLGFFGLTWVRKGVYISDTSAELDQSFLGVRLKANGGNPKPRIRLTTSDGQQLREVQIGSNYLSQNATEVHFGLADYDGVVKLEIVHPQTGENIVIENVTVNQWLTLPL